MGIRVRGSNKIKREIAKMSQRITVGSVRGLAKVAKVVERKTGWSGRDPLIPVRTGALRRSWFSIPYRAGGVRNRAIRFGYRQRYAAYQHDPHLYTKNSGRWNYTRARSGPNYLRSTIVDMGGGFRSPSNQGMSIKKIVERNIKYAIRR